MDKIARIRQEIERQIGYAKNTNYPKGSIENERATAIVAVCLDILSFIDSLSEEPDKSLEEAARLYAIPPYMKDIDVHHIEEYPYNTGLEAAFKAGAEWQKTQMMKDAVECVVCAGMEGDKWIMTYIGDYESMLKTCKAGDKVRIIIVKED